MPGLLHDMNDHSFLPETPDEPPDRQNMDKTINAYGNRLINFCLTTGILIVNGRKGDNGLFTCNDASTIDYFLTDHSTLAVVQSLSVLDFDPLFSDIHSIVAMTLMWDIPHYTSALSMDKNISTNVTKWIPEKASMFSSNLSEDNALVILQTINNVHEVDIELVESLNTNFLDLFQAAASQSNMTNKKIFKRKPKPNNQPWYNRDCKMSQRKYRYAKRQFQRFRTVGHKQSMIEEAKTYRKTLRQAKANFDEKLAMNLRQCKSHNPKQFWKILETNKKSTIEGPSIEDFEQHFLSVNVAQSNNQYQKVPLLNDNSNPELNQQITVEEVQAAIKHLKSGKSPGEDNILNEFFKCSTPTVVEAITAYFNLIFDSGIIPNCWGKGIIIPIYKNKGTQSSPDNYRGITLISSFCKLFTSVLNRRLQKYIDSYNILNQEQAGFRQNNSTADHVFALKTILDLYLSRKKELFCAFIDYRKAFDSIDRDALWLKLYQHNINGKFLTVIQNIYRQAVSQVRWAGNNSTIFTCKLGVRQGDNLSPVLFSLYLNDLVSFLDQKCRGLSQLSELTHKYMDTDTLYYHLKLFILLYADDTVILSDTAEDLQEGLIAMEEYCKLWALQINTEKTKVCIFTRKRKLAPNNFLFNGDSLEIVNSFNYLGVAFSSSGRFALHLANRVSASRKAVFSLLQKIRKFQLPIDLSLYLFDMLIVPVMFYGIEVWGYENLEQFEKIHLKFCKDLLHLRESTANCMVYGETGRFPLFITAETRVVSFWHSLHHRRDNLSCLLLSLITAMHNNNLSSCKWFDKVHSIVNRCGLTYLLTNPAMISKTQIKDLIQNRLRDQFIQMWFAKIESMSSCCNYKLFKLSFGQSVFFRDLPVFSCRLLCKFRTGNLNFPATRNLFNCEHQGHCHLCNLNVSGDAYHYLLVCPAFFHVRRQYLKAYFVTFPNYIKFAEIMSCNNIEMLKKIVSFVKIINSKLNTH